jgi:hypothetical protein
VTDKANDAQLAPTDVRRPWAVVKLVPWDQKQTPTSLNQSRWTL